MRHGHRAVDHGGHAAIPRPSAETLDIPPEFRLPDHRTRQPFPLLGLEYHLIQEFRQQRGGMVVHGPDHDAIRRFGFIAHRLQCMRRMRRLAAIQSC